MTKANRLFKNDNKKYTSDKLSVEIVLSSSISNKNKAHTILTQKRVILPSLCESLCKVFSALY